jgi:putative transposase
VSTSSFRPRNADRGSPETFANGYGRINHEFFKTWNVIQSRIGGAPDHVHVLCNLTKKFSTAKVVEILKKDSSKFMKTLGIPNFHWQDGYGLFSVSSSHFEAVRKYILDQEERHKKETFQDEYLRILKKCGAPYNEQYLWD